MTEYEYEYYSVRKRRQSMNIIWFEKKQPNTNMTIIRFEKITRIRIRILVFGLNYSNNIRIPNYSLTSATLHIVQCAETQLVQNMVDRDIGLDINETASIWSTPTSQASISLSMLGKK